MKLFVKVFVVIVIIAVAVSAGCPNGQPLVNCVVDPCTVTTCPGTPDAECVANYCGGCHADFFNSDGELALCPKEQPVYNCLVDPCEGKTCPGTPDAQCVANYCGGCNAEFYTCGCVPACCGGHNQPCDTGLPHASEDDCACQGDLVCCANEDDFRTGTCLTQQEADKKGDICNPSIRG
uniref:IGFBP N-terminal domain-containing protein n=1 Tax=Branchiostoma floridae TaxID=7739 RepID=C3YKY0_BRAFL|eukprot:XP_002602959.1 hypothetical protein BRAFLDRAFT_105864 [Branchiostoma floridae]